MGIFDLLITIPSLNAGQAQASAMKGLVGVSRFVDGIEAVERDTANNK
jgi:hypothetical protein